MKLKSLLTKIFIVVIIAIACIIPISIKYGYQKTYTITVTDKTVKRGKQNNDGKAKDKYLIFAKTQDGKIKTFEITDLPLKFKFNSSDIYGQLEKDHIYKIETTGVRVPISSWYQNINSCTEIDKVIDNE